MSVRLERDARLARLIVDRPPLNILDLATLEELEAQVEALAADPPQLVVVRGAGERAFSAGVAVEDHTGERIAPTLAAFHGAIRKLRRLPSITLAVVTGHCLGGGMELALACDLVLAAETARFGQPEIKLGCFPPVAAALYPYKLGRARTLELLLTGRALTCEEADELGLVTWRVEPAALEAKLDEVAGTLLSQSAAASALTKRAAGGPTDEEFERALAEAERIYLEELASTDDMNEGIAAFLEKRPPTWKHR